MGGDRWSTGCLILLGCAAWFGNACYAFGAPGSEIKFLSPAIVAIASTAFFIWHGGRRYGGKMMLRFLAVVFTVGWFFETLSVVTSVPFGRYHYTDVMAPFLGHVPVFVLPAYLFMGYTSWSMATLLLGYRSAKLPLGAVWSVPPLAAFFMVLWDLSMDPLRASVEGRWIWVDGGSYLGVPLSNYLGWFVVTWCMFQAFAVLLTRSAEDERPDLSNDRQYWAAIPVMYACFAGEYLLNPLIGHGHTQIAAGQTAIAVQDIFLSVAFVSTITLIPALIIGLMSACDVPLARAAAEPQRACGNERSRK